MTKDQWYRSNHPAELLEALAGPLSPRKLRLAACACCRRIWGLLRDPRLYDAVGFAERFADGEESEEGLQAVQAVVLSVGRAGQEATADYDHMTSQYSPSSAVSLATRDVPSVTHAAFWAANAVEAEAYFCKGAFRDQLDGILAEENRWHSLFIRDVFGGAFCPARVLKRWLRWQDGTVVKLAEVAYDERRLPGGELEASKLAIVADALEEAGCPHEDMLAHLRGPGPHVRGCWVIDRLLGKE